MPVCKGLLWLYVLTSILCSVACVEQNESAPSPVPTTATSNDLVPTDPLLFISTLDGTLHAVSKRTGLVKWKLDEDPVLNVPMESATSIKGPTFLPDPHDGSLYAYDPASQALSKLPFTIPELVQASPCKSSDGILYTGRKQDVWYAINPSTGAKRRVITTENSDDKCPGGTAEDMFIGRSEYKVIMFDTKSNIMRWNVTFTDYSSHANEKVAHNYELLHLASSSDGLVVTVDRETGNILWVQNYGYPVVAMYSWVPEGLQRVEMITVAKETLDYVMQQANKKVSYWDTILQSKHKFHPKESTLVPSLYVGQYQHSLYALPAMTHDGVKFNMHRNVQMLPGPDDADYPVTRPGRVDIASMPIPVWRIIGYYDVPPYSKVNVPKTDMSVPSKPLLLDHDTSTIPDQMPVPEPHIYPRDKPPQQHRETKETFPPKTPSSHSEPQPLQATVQIRWNEITLVAVLTSILTGVLIIFMLKRPHFGSTTSQQPSHYDGLVRVGRISLDPHDVVGRGSEGTIVYRGHFDGRGVAVKRVVTECFSFADREVALLRESDEHSNVIRYHCMERDTQFQYIALELCSNTLQEYVENPQYRCSTGLDTQTVIHQAMMGLDHLHRLKIVHRDVKPSNILISVPGKLGVQRVVISDFGLCKKLVPGRVSFSHKSGTAGTDGWIAPEMLMGDRYRMTQAVDIFSIGCVFYYVICGKHPFGDSLSRQARIVNGEYSLNELKQYEYAEEACDLIRKMLLIDPNMRPKADAVLKHPLFWDSIRKLQYFEDVSDRIEKEPADSLTMQKLDRDSLMDIANGIPRDWVQHLCRPLQEDLHKFRAYKVHSVRDLLRAIRNKKHHYRELPDNVKQSLGSLPDEYLQYFTSRFPRLLIHTYLSMACCRSETTLQMYYSDRAPDHVYYDVDESGTTVFTKPALISRSTWKAAKTSSSASEGSPRPVRTTKTLSAADQDLDWRSSSGKSSIQTSPSSAFKSLLKTPNANRHFPNGYVSPGNPRYVEENDFNEDRRNSSFEEAAIVEYSESYSVESRTQLVTRGRLRNNGSPRVSECTTATSDSTDNSRIARQSQEQNDSSRKSRSTQETSPINRDFEESKSRLKRLLPPQESDPTIHCSNIFNSLTPDDTQEKSMDEDEGQTALEEADLITESPKQEEDVLNTTATSDTAEGARDEEDHQELVIPQEEFSVAENPNPKKTKPRRRRFKKNKSKNSALNEMTGNLPETDTTEMSISSPSEKQ